MDRECHIGAARVVIAGRSRTSPALSLLLVLAILVAACGSHRIPPAETTDEKVIKTLKQSLGYSAIYSEALMMGAKAGLTPAAMDSVLRGGRMDCSQYQAFFEYVLRRDENAQRFSMNNALKDLTYLSSFAGASGAANPISAAVRNSFAAAVGAGQGDKFVPALSDVIAKLNGVSLV